MNTLFDILLNATWQSMVLAAGVLLIVTLFRERLAPRFRYLLWCVVLLRLALPILPASPWGVLPNQMNQRHDGNAIPIDNLTSHRGGHGVTALPYDMDVLPHDATVLSENHNHEHTFMATPSAVPVLETPAKNDTRANVFATAKMTVLAIWLLGVVVFAIRYVGDEIRLYRQSRYWKPVKDAKLLALFESCRKQLGIRRRVALLSVSHGIGAASSGTLRPRVLLAERAMMHSDAGQLRMVMLHELVHLRRFDPLVLRAAVILSVIHWLNPVVWLAMSRLQRDRELACDAAVLHKLELLMSHRAEKAAEMFSPGVLDAGRKQYGDAVLAFATKFSPQVMPQGRMPGLVGLFQKNAIKRRIEMILKYKKPNLLYVLLGVLLVTVVAAFGLTRAQPQKINTPIVVDEVLTEMKTITLSETDVFIFTDGQWTDEKTGVVIPDGGVVQGTQGTFCLEQEDGNGKVVRLSGDGSQGQGKYVRFSNGGNSIEVSQLELEIHKELKERGIAIGMDDVFVFDDGQWKNELTGDVIPMETLVTGTRGLFRLEQENGEGKITLIIGGGATGHGKYIRWSGGGNAYSESKP